jgi:hypothetical protein
MLPEGPPDHHALWVDQLRESARRQPSEWERSWLTARAESASRLEKHYRRACIVGCLASTTLAFRMLATSPLGTGPSVAPGDVTTAVCAAAPAGFGLVCTLAELVFGFAVWRRVLAALTLSAFVLGLVWFVHGSERYVPAVVVLSGALLALGGTTAGVITLTTLRRARINAVVLADAVMHGAVVTFTRAIRLQSHSAPAEPLEVLVPSGLMLHEGERVLVGREPLQFVHVRSVVEDGALQPTVPLDSQDSERQGDGLPSTRRLTVLEQAEVMQAAKAALRGWATRAGWAAFVGAQVARLAARWVELPPGVVWPLALAPAAFFLARGVLLWRSHRTDAIEGEVVLVDADVGLVEFLPRSMRVFSVAGIPEPWRGAAP